MARRPKTQVRQADATAEEAERLLKLAEHRWFGGRFPADGEAAVVRLVLGAYLANARGQPIHKKAAAAVMGVEDVRTARKYVDLVEQHGLLRGVPDTADKRRELLIPSDELARSIPQEIRKLEGILAGRGDQRESGGVVVGDFMAALKLSAVLRKADADVHNPVAQAERYEAEADAIGKSLELLGKTGLPLAQDEIRQIEEATANEQALLRRVAADLRRSVNLSKDEQEKAIQEAHSMAKGISRFEATRKNLGSHGAERGREDAQVAAVRPYLKLMQDVRPEDLTEDERKNGERHEDMLSDRIAVEPKNAHLYGFRGEVRRALGRVGEAIADVTQAIKLDPRNGTFRVRRGQWLLLMGRAQEATVDLEQGVELGLRDYEEHAALTELDRAYAVLGDEERGRKIKERLKMSSVGS